VGSPKALSTPSQAKQEKAWHPKVAERRGQKSCIKLLLGAGDKPTTITKRCIYSSKVYRWGRPSPVGTGNTLKAKRMPFNWGMMFQR